MALLEPFEVMYPVAFYSGGDTTREAFNKHIQEIERIYGALNALNAAAVSSDDVGTSIDSKIKAHIDSPNPHPKWKPSLSFSDITGNLDGSRITGKLTNAEIDAGKVNGLKDLITTTAPDKGDGITGSNIKDNGYVKFNNGLIIQWGAIYSENFNEGLRKASFPTNFATSCFNVTPAIMFKDNVTAECNIWVQLIKEKTTLSDFTYAYQFAESIPSSSYAGKIGVSYIAIGI